MKKIFVYENKMFALDVLVVIDTSYDKLKKWILANAEKNFKEVFKNDIIKNNFNRKTVDGSMHNINYKGRTYNILELKKFDDKWSSYELLLHEVVHFKQFLFRNLCINDEDEFEAYFIQNTFRDIRKLINKNYFNN